MKASPFLIRTLGPLLAFGGLAAAQEKGQFIEMRLQKISDPLQGPFRTFIPFQMGNQSLKALFDTGSSDLVVPRTASQICKVELQQCDEKGTGFLAGSFDPAKAKVSNTSIPLDAKFTGGSAFSGSFINTAVSAGQKSNNSLTMRVGLIEGGSLPPESPLFSVFGFGPVDGESAAPNQTYPNFPARLKQEKKIKCNALGLAVGDYRKSTSQLRACLHSSSCHMDSGTSTDGEYGHRLQCQRVGRFGWCRRCQVRREAPSGTSRPRSFRRNPVICDQHVICHGHGQGRPAKEDWPRWKRCRRRQSSGQG